MISAASLRARVLDAAARHRRGIIATVVASLTGFTVTAFGLATVVFGLSTNFWLSVLALTLTGAVDNVSVVVRITLMQLETPDDMRGRVASVNTIFIGASNQLGEFESGAVAAVWGPVASAVSGGLGTLVVALLWRRWFPELAQRDRLTPQESALH